jgi:hypothetical protein
MQGQCSEHEADSDSSDSVDDFVHDVPWLLMVEV